MRPPESEERRPGRGGAEDLSEVDFIVTADTNDLVTLAFRDGYARGYQDGWDAWLSHERRLWAEIRAVVRRASSGSSLPANERAARARAAALEAAACHQANARPWPAETGPINPHAYEVFPVSFAEHAYLAGRDAS